jgi:tetratricopeptide (TPR) repeat protein
MVDMLNPRPAASSVARADGAPGVSRRLAIGAAVVAAIPAPATRAAGGSAGPAAAPAGSPRGGGAAAPPAPLFDGMGAYRAGAVSASALARRYVDQGMVLTWGFNPAEAARSFAGALAHDPVCLAALWGLAWAAGPNINADMAAADAPQVDDALRQARALGGDARSRWRELIDALSARHPKPGTTEVDEVAYERRVQALAERHPRDADLALLAAEALMNLHPYDWWRADGHPQPWTPEIERRLRRALALAPSHPGANHAWVHLIEQSPAPGRARVQADRLRTLVPGSGHLLHMPAHIDMRLGDYAAAVRANERAIRADRRYLEQVDAQGAYRIGYVAHNHHFLWAAASMQGLSAKALAAAREAYPAACGPSRPDPADRNAGTLQHFEVLPLFALVRFGRWQDLLTGTRPPDGNAPYPLAIWHYARGTACTRLGRIDDAKAELARLWRIGDDPALAAARVKRVHAAATLASIARHTLQADLALAQGRAGEAVPLLRQAVALEDGLERDEPHLWLAPTRHALGAALLAAGQPAEAGRVFDDDLRHYPANGWALAGLRDAQQALGRTAAAQASEARLRLAWRDADIALPGARF